MSDRDLLRGLEHLKDALREAPGTSERAAKFIGIAAAECLLARFTQGQALEVFSRTFMELEANATTRRPRHDGAVKVVKPTVYILHFNEPVSGQHRHYVGCSDNLPRRVLEHASGDERAALVCRAAKRQCISFTLGMVKDDFGKLSSWEFEQKLKRSRHLERWCDICKGSAILKKEAAGLPRCIAR